MTFWGVRGSIAVPGPDTVRYGGNTPCVSLKTSASCLFIFDAGTGIRNLGKLISSRKEATEAILLLSHSHWDHIQGFPLFAPAYRKDFCLKVLGNPAHPTSLQEILRQQMDTVVWPTPLEALTAKIEIGDYCIDRATYDKVSLQTLHLNHPGGSCGFRIQDQGKSFIYMTDNELPEPGSEGWDKFVDYCRNADMLVHDAQYTDEELPQHKGWGHSSVTQAIRLAMDAEVKKLALFHHDPDRTDDDIDKIVVDCKHYVLAQKSDLQIFAAAEGQVECI